MLSILMPVYNTEKFLPACLDSLLHQTYTDFEAILVNDGSTDGSLDVLNAYAAKDARLRVFTQPNGGAASARNAAFAQARGDLIGFLDSDDTIDPTLFAHLIALKQAHGAQIALCGFWRTSDGRPAPKAETVTVLEKRQFMPLLLMDKIDSYLPMKLFDRALFPADFAFPVGHIVEDMAVTPALFERADRIVQTDAPLYCYNVDNASGTTQTTRSSLRGALGRGRCMAQRYEIAKISYPDCADDVLTSAVWFYTECALMLRHQPKEEAASERAEVRAFLRKHLGQTLRCSKITIKRKLLAAWFCLA